MIQLVSLVNTGAKEQPPMPYNLLRPNACNLRGIADIQVRGFAEV
jgi:hypothetical protein